MEEEEVAMTEEKVDVDLVEDRINVQGATTKMVTVEAMTMRMTRNCLNHALQANRLSQCTMQFQMSSQVKSGRTALMASA